MKVLIVFLALSATLFSFTIINNFDKSPESVTFKSENVVSTETLDEGEISKISEALNFTTVVSAKVLSMKDGGTFLEYTTVLDGKTSTFKTVGLTGTFVPPCHCGPGADGIYNAWWEGRTPYQYKNPYCLPCAIVDLPDGETPN